MAKTKTQILIVDDDADILTACRLLLKKHFDKVVTTNKPEFIPDLMAKENFDAILLDMNFQVSETSGREGLKWLDQILQIDRDAVVILFTAFSSVDSAVAAMKMGAADFIEKPWKNERLVATMKAAVRLRNAQGEASRLKQQNRVLSDEIRGFHQPILGESPAINKVLALVQKAAPTDANILILGENGTGKELIAREIHAQSKRADEIFVSVDLGAVPASLFESELFGHKKGSFTDAFEDRPGRVRAADKGTLFLDEVGNLPLPLQPKLLTALENRSVTPVGESRSFDFDIRLISATNLRPGDLKDSRVFRPDLLYRLNTVEIHVPPLRDRQGDVPILARAFLSQFARKYNRPVMDIGPEAMARLEAYAWPGNVRELRHCIERAVILSEGETLGPQDFGGLVEGPGGAAKQTLGGKTLDEVEKAVVIQALEKHQGNISKAAKDLGLTRTSLYRRIEKYEL